MLNTGVAIREGLVLLDPEAADLDEVLSQVYQLCQSIGIPFLDLDLSVVGVLTVVCSMLGLPWLIAATVRSLNHVRALARVGFTNGV